MYVFISAVDHLAWILDLACLFIDGLGILMLGNCGYDQCR